MCAPGRGAAWTIRNTVFFTESFIDELAVAAKADPFAFRRDLLPAGSRYRAVLERAAREAGWGGTLPPRSGRGIALIEAFGSIVAEVAEVSVSPTGDVRVRRVTAVVDCGDLVHPDTATSQLEGGIIFGLSAALFSEITIDKGAVLQSNFSDYVVAKNGRRAGNRRAFHRVARPAGRYRGSGRAGGRTRGLQCNLCGVRAAGAGVANTHFGVAGAAGFFVGVKYVFLRKSLRRLGPEAPDPHLNSCVSTLLPSVESKPRLELWANAHRTFAP